MKKRYFPRSKVCSGRILFPLVLAALVTSACKKPAATSSRGARPVAEVQVGPVALRPMEQVVTVLGTLKSMDQATLSIKTTGRLKALPVDVGSQVRAGDIVAQIEPRDYELKVQQAAAFLAQARARLGLDLDGEDDRVDPEKSSNVRQARALFDEAQSNLDRIRKLETARISSEAELERAEAEAEVTHNQYLDALQEAHERQAVLAQRRAEFEIARQQLSDTALRSPFDGIVQERLTNVGEYLPGGSPVLTLVRTNPLRLQADIPERRSSEIHEGLAVRMSLEGDTNVYSGVLNRVSPALDARTRMLRVEAEFENPGHLRPGRFARVDIVTHEAEPTLAVPLDAVVTFAGTEKAFVVRTNAAVECRLVLGRRDSSWVEVVEGGLHAGEVVVRNPGGLQSGDPVRVVEPDAKPSS